MDAGRAFMRGGMNAVEFITCINALKKNVMNTAKYAHIVRSAHVAILDEFDAEIK